MLKRAHTNRLLPKRDLCSRSIQTMRVKLVRKFANILNGIDLTKISVGDVINVAPHQAAMLILEGWAEEAPHGAADARRSFASQLPRIPQ